MGSIRHWLIAFGLVLASLTAAASPAAPQSGVEYLTLEAPQPTDTGKKVEVIEFFGYFCSHCYSWDPLLKEWAKRQGDNIVFKRVHIGFSASMLPQQKMFYALTAMGKLEALHPRIFHAVQVERQPLRRDEQVFDFVAKNGVDRNKFIEMYNSFSVESMTRSATQMQSLYKVDGVPMIAIDGRFITSPALVSNAIKQNASEAELQAATLKVMDALVKKVQAEKGNSAARKR